LLTSFPVYKCRNNPSFFYNKSDYNEKYNKFYLLDLQQLDIDDGVISKVLTMQAMEGETELISEIK
jgi:hypothetical protein